MKHLLCDFSEREPRIYFIISDPSILFGTPFPYLIINANMRVSFFWFACNIFKRVTIAKEFSLYFGIKLNFHFPLNLISSKNYYMDLLLYNILKHCAKKAK
jgi:hypothetical protein